MGRVAFISRSPFALGLCAALAGCGGVPSADPPDFLPTPMITVGPETQPTSGPGIESVGPVAIKGQAGELDADDRVWIVNLDAQDEAPQVITPESDGSFEAEVMARVGDRIRIVSRGPTNHSHPLDLEAVRGLEMTALAPLQDQSLPCLTLTPAGELDLGEKTSRSAQFTLENRCTQAVTIASRTLRFGTENIVISAPDNVAAGASAELAVSLAGTFDQEIWDILLLEVASGTERGRYALSLWAR